MAQFLGMDEYVPVEESTYRFEKQYVIGENLYDYQIQDEEGADGNVSFQDFEIVWYEMNRILTDNDLTVEVDEVVHGKSSGDFESIVKALKKNTKHVMIRYKMSNGYYLFLNLQDSFCGIAITEEKNS